MTTQPEDAMTRERVLEEALITLVSVKDYKDKNGKGLAYEQAARSAWEKARIALASAQQEPAPSADALATIAELEKRIGKLEAVIAWANNSLYGSHGFFLSTNGGPPNEHHLDEAIEKLKAQARSEWHRAEAAEQALTAERQWREECEKQLAEIKPSEKNK